MKIRTLCTVLALLVMLLACCPGAFREWGWTDAAGLALKARHCCFHPLWLAVLAGLLLWHLFARLFD